DPEAFLGESLEAVRAQDDRHIEFDLELLDGTRQARLGDVTMLGGPAEMTVLLQGDEIVELSEKHARITTRNMTNPGGIAMAGNDCAEHSSRPPEARPRDVMITLRRDPVEHDALRVALGAR